MVKRIKIPRSGEAPSFLAHTPDPEVVKKLHEGRLKIKYYYDWFERLESVEDKEDEE